MLGACAHIARKNDFYRHYHDDNQQPFHYDKHSKDKVLESMPYLSHCTTINASTHYGPIMTWLTRTLDSTTTVASNRNHENKSAILRSQIEKTDILPRPLTRQFQFRRATRPFLVFVARRGMGPLNGLLVSSLYCQARRAGRGRLGGAFLIRWQREPRNRRGGEVWVGFLAQTHGGGRTWGFGA